MLSAKNILAVIVVVSIGLVGGALISGCDFQDVGAKSDGKLDNVLTSLSSAATTAEAEIAIRDLMAEVGINNPSRPGPYSHFTLANSQVSGYAEQVVKHNQGLMSVSDTYGSVVSAFAKQTKQQANVGKVIEHFNALLEEAYLIKDESPGKLLLAAASSGPLGASAPRVAATDPIAPFQRHLFTIWLTRGVESTSVFYTATEAASKDPLKKIDICHYAAANPHTISIPFNKNFSNTYLKHLAHGDFPGECSVLNCSKFCYGDKLTECLGACPAPDDLVCDPYNPFDPDCCAQTCQMEAYLCDLDCHYQGEMGLLPCGGAINCP